MKINELITKEQAEERGMDNIPVQAGKGLGYRKLSDNTLGMLRCFECGTENYVLQVSSGICYCCGFNANKLR
jgi:ribosomal protein L37E